MAIHTTLSEQLEKHSKRFHEKTSEKEKHKKSKKVHRMTIERAEGGYSIEHHKERKMGDMYEEPEHHVVSSGRELVKHVKEHMGDEEEQNG